MRWAVPGLLDAVDAALRGFEKDAFLEALPDLRPAFAALDPRETDRMAEESAGRHGRAARPRPHRTHRDAELARGTAIDAAMAEVMRADGLHAWLEGA